MTLDTNVIIAYLEGDQRVIQTLSSWKENGYSLILSTVVESEVLSFSEWTDAERRETEFFLERHFSSSFLAFAY
jgi:predicted nucleic acid-binding protein